MYMLFFTIMAQFSGCIICLSERECCVEKSEGLSVLCYLLQFSNISCEELFLSMGVTWLLAVLKRYLFVILRECCLTVHVWLHVLYGDWWLKKQTNESKPNNLLSSTNSINVIISMSCVKFMYCIEMAFKRGYSDSWYFSLALLMLS